MPAGDRRLHLRSTSLQLITSNGLSQFRRLVIAIANTFCKSKAPPHRHRLRTLTHAQQTIAINFLLIYFFTRIGAVKQIVCRGACLLATEDNDLSL